MKIKVGSIVALAVLLLLAAAMACSNDSDDNVETPAPGLKESTIELAAEGTWVLELLDGRPVIEDSKDSAITLRRCPLEEQ